MPILLCTDLDRTLLPNGPQAESPGARAALWDWVSRTGSRLAFVSGRRLALHLEAVAEYHLPMPDHLIADVGATIYDRGPDGEWAPNAGWHQLLAKSWKGREWQDVLPLVSDLEELELQEESEQAAHKLSFNVPDLRSRERVLTMVRKRLDEAFIMADLIWSVDETVPMGLLDVMAPGATKLDAVRWLVQNTGTAPDRVLYAGDSGNDIPVLASEIPAVLVANATDEVRAEALHLSQRNGHPEKLYLAKGILSGMNGCYAAGILEGLAHFFPEASGESLE
ncbi:MAG: HAD-IIB family hydrolase [Verrucomicrobiales bacterium]